MSMRKEEAMTHEEKAREIVALHEFSMKRRGISSIIEDIASALASAEKKGKEDCMRNNLLLNEIRNEQFALGKKQGWNKAIEEAVKVAEKCTCVRCDTYIAKAINKLRKE